MNYYAYRFNGVGYEPGIGRANGSEEIVATVRATSFELGATGEPAVSNGD